MYIVGPVPQVVHGERKHLASDGATKQGLPDRGQVLGEDRYYLNAHGRHTPSQSSKPAGGLITSRPPAKSTSGTIACTNGTSTSPFTVSRISRSLAGACTTSRTVPSFTPSGPTAT